MNTFALILATWTAVSGQPVSSDEMVIDHHMSQEDCLAAVSAYEPRGYQLPAGLVVAHNIRCEAEKK